MLTRRQFLGKSGAAAVATAGLTTLSGSAAAHRTSYIPDHVSITYDKSWLENHQPKLNLSSSDREKLLGIYGWKVTSPEYSTDVGVYWASYTHQEGVTSYTSHYGDHEPMYVFANSDTGDTTLVVASIYHWIAGKGLPPLDGQQPRLRVISPWHHYTAAAESTTLSTPSLSSLGIESQLRDDKYQSEFESWLDNGLAKDLEPGTAVEPWTMSSRESWWRRGTFDFSITKQRVELARLLGRGESGSLEGST